MTMPEALFLFLVQIFAGPCCRYWSLFLTLCCYCIYNCMLVCWMWLVFMSHFIPKCLHIPVCIVYCLYLSDALLLFHLLVFLNWFTCHCEHLYMFLFENWTLVVMVEWHCPDTFVDTPIWYGSLESYMCSSITFCQVE